MPTSEKKQLFNRIRNEMRRINACKIDPDFTRELEKRKKRKVRLFKTNDELLKIFAQLIAYSQSAQSDVVDKLIDAGHMETAFNGFDAKYVAQLNPFTVIDAHWEQLSGMRFQSKVFHIISVARKLEKERSILELFQQELRNLDLRKHGNIEQFWASFEQLLAKMKAYKVDFFQSTTSLLHFLMDIGYDCVKPDLAVMRAAKELRLVTEATGEENLRRVVRLLQEFSLENQIRPAVVDLYFLIRGQQKAAKKFVHNRYYE